MNIKAIIPSGQTEITVNGLRQWDYGQKLEIHSDELPALIEVHFACSGMTEAVVRTCGVVDGVATADIPDRCIEQTTPIVAWVYCVDDTSAQTTHTIIMPIIARTKPAPRPSVPTVVTDQYTQLIGAINEQIGALADGTVTAGKAIKATQDGNGNNIADTYLLKTAKAQSAHTADYSQTSQKLAVSIDNPALNIAVAEFGDSYTVEGLDMGVYLVILDLVREKDGDENNRNHYTGVGYIGKYNANKWESYEISLGEDMFISVGFSPQMGANKAGIGVNIRQNKGMDLGRAGTLKLYKIASITQG